VTGPPPIQARRALAMRSILLRTSSTSRARVRGFMTTNRKTLRPSSTVELIYPYPLSFSSSLIFQWIRSESLRMRFVQRLKDA